MAPHDRDPRELVQEVWLRVIRGIGRLREPARLRPWLFGIARRVAMDTLRDHYATPPTEDLDHVDPPATEATDTHGVLLLLAVFLLRRAQRAFTRLTEQRQALARRAGRTA